MDHHGTRDTLSLLDFAFLVDSDNFKSSLSHASSSDQL